MRISDFLHPTKVGEKKPKKTDQEITSGEQFRKEPKTKLNPPAK